MYSRYYIFLATDVQLSDVAKFCCDENNVFYVDTTFNLCKNWVSDSCFNNARLETSKGKHPIFHGPSMIHFEKTELIFSHFINEMCTFEPPIRSLKSIGTDLERTIFNGCASQITDLRLFLCALHLQKSDKRKLQQLVPKKGSVAIDQILRDIYGCQYGSIEEYGLADSKDPSDLNERIEKLKDKWEELCPSFHKWFVEKRKHERERQKSNIHGLFYNIGIESQHFKEKKEQCFEEGNIKMVIETMKTLIERQEDDEVRAIYASGPYRLRWIPPDQNQNI